MSARGIILTAEQLDALAAQVAQRLTAALTAPTPDAALIDAAEIARRHGVTRSWVYEHADRLGAIRLGNGTRPRLRFNPDTVARQLSSSKDDAPPPPVQRSGTRRRPGTTTTGAPLLPIASTDGLTA